MLSEISAIIWVLCPFQLKGSLAQQLYAFSEKFCLYLLPLVFISGNIAVNLRFKFNSFIQDSNTYIAQREVGL